MPDDDFPQGFKELFQIPEGPFLEAPRSHRAFVKAINSDLLDHPRDRINDGVNSFKAIREDRELNVFETASAIGMEVEKYTAIERGWLAPTSEEVLQFCSPFGCFPYDLASDHTAILPCIRDAMLLLLEKPEILGLDSHPDREEILDEVRLTLIDSVSDDNTTSQMQARKNGAEKFPNMALLANLLSFLLENDGAGHLYADGAVLALVNDFIEDAEIDLKKIERRKLVSEACYKQKKDDFNKMGWALYPKNSQWVSWPNAHAVLFQARDRRFKGNSLKMINFYRKTPVSIGRDRWPCFKTTQIRYRDKEMGWSEGHKRHVRMLQDYVQSSAQMQNDKAAYDKMKKQIDALYVFCENNVQLFARFQNRQIVMHHDEMPLFMPESKRLSRLKNFTI